MSAYVQSIITSGNDGIAVDVQCSLSNNLPNIVIVGYANKAVDEAKERIRGAFAYSRIMLPRKRITVNLAPADIPKGDSGFDIAIALSILVASQQVSVTQPKQTAYIAELGLDGATRPVRGIIGKLLVGRSLGITKYFVAAGNLEQAQLVPGVTLFPVNSLSELYNHMAGTNPLPAINTGSGVFAPPEASRRKSPRQSLQEIVGQHQAKRALEIAAAGGHNIFFSGPPGTGKSMLAKALPDLLPELNREEVLAVTHLHSLASHRYDQIITQRPFRSPHHSASHVAIIGGGLNLRPGEISLAHRGILFFDELPEFNRLTLEALRQPLEDRIISVARAKDTAEYPANFIFVATANPCPCGYYGTAQTCQCMPAQISRYQQKLSGPILDRIDLYSPVHEVEHARLLDATKRADDDEIRSRIAQARKLQEQRYNRPSLLNADMTNKDIKLYAKLDDSARALLTKAAQRLNVSARTYMRTIKVARTIADLSGSDNIRTMHIGEALAYRCHHLVGDDNR